MVKGSNELVKVYSFRRSGTNVLCALLHENFYYGEDMKGPVDMDPLKMYRRLDGSVSSRSPYGALFGSHDRFPHIEDIGRALYIRRDAYDTAYSLYNFYRGLRRIPDIPFREYVDGSGVLEQIRCHHRTALQLGLFTVTYEELTECPESTRATLERISRHFRLTRQPPQWVLIDQRIGWNPGRALSGLGEKAYKKNAG